MEKIKAELLNYSPEKVIINAVSKPYKNENIDINTVKKVGRILKHESVLEFINLDFEISGISRLCLQELVRHRMSSFCVESTRFTINKLIEGYTGFNLMTFCVFPLAFYKKEDEDNLLRQYINKLKYDLDLIFKLSKEGYKNDDLKYFLPESWRVNLSMSMNLRSFLNFLELRDNEKAHFEIKYLAGLMKNEIENTYIKELI
jgi:thymidylate synthase (FAD)